MQKIKKLVNREINKDIAIDKEIQQTEQIKDIEYW